MENREAATQARLFQYIHGYRLTQLVYVAAELKIADFLKDGPRDSHYLAAATDTHEPSLYRVLRALASIQVFKESGQGFAITDLSRYLLADSPGSLRVLALMRGEEVNWKPWGELLYAVKTGDSPLQKVFGLDLFEYYEKHPLSGQTFNEGMKVTTQHDIQAILDHCDFSDARTLVEIGGGLGQLLFAILAEYPDLHGILYDLPHVVRDAYALRTRFQLENRCEIIGGEFFSAVPEGGDVYLLKRIIHDWDDERAVKILRNCHHAMKDEDGILVFETMVQDNYDSPEGKVNDIHMMMVTPGGRERTAEEFARLFQAAGFILTRIIPLGTGLYSGLYAIEGRRR